MRTREFAKALAAFVVLIDVVVVTHEAGHLVAARLAGVAVEEFSVGFGPRLASATVGSTRYALSAVPLGGYVALKGEKESAGALPRDSFRSRGLGTRAAVVLAGPAANFAFAALVLFALHLAGHPYLPARVGDVAEGSPASSAGVRPGDVVARFGGRPVGSWRELCECVRGWPSGTAAEIEVVRGSASETLSVVPARGDGRDGACGSRIGALPSRSFETRPPKPAGAALAASARQCAEVAAATFATCWLLLRRRISLRAVGGPIAMARIARTGVAGGLRTFGYVTAVVTVNIGALNLLPLVPLDGGSAALYGVERFWAVPPGARAAVEVAGAALLVAFAATVLVSDFAARKRPVYLGC